MRKDTIRNTSRVDLSGRAHACRDRESCRAAPKIKIKGVEKIPETGEGRWIVDPWRSPYRSDTSTVVRAHTPSLHGNMPSAAQNCQQNANKCPRTCSRTEMSRPHANASPGSHAWRFPHAGAAHCTSAELCLEEAGPTRCKVVAKRLDFCVVSCYTDDAKGCGVSVVQLFVDWCARTSNERRHSAISRGSFKLVEFINQKLKRFFFRRTVYTSFLQNISPRRVAKVPLVTSFTVTYGCFSIYNCREPSSRIWFFFLKFISFPNG